MLPRNPLWWSQETTATRNTPPRESGVFAHHTKTRTSPHGVLRRLAALAGATALSVAALVALAGPAQAADEYTITSLSPTQGPTSGGTVVTITGTGFTPVTNDECDEPVAHVFFGDVDA
jgi:IPT/TIG domain